MAFKKDSWVRIILPSVFFLITVYGNKIFSTPFTAEKQFHLAELAVLTISIFELNRYITIRVRNNISKLNQIKKRLTISFFFCIIINFIILFTVNYMHRKLFPAQTGNSGTFWVFTSLTDSFFISLVVVIVHESIFFYNRLLKSEKEKEELVKTQLQSQYDSL